jgi:hypothetical protein
VASTPTAYISVGGECVEIASTSPSKHLIRISAPSIIGRRKQTESGGVGGIGAELGGIGVERSTGCGAEDVAAAAATKVTGARGVIRAVVVASPAWNKIYR